ncbi:MAG: ATP-binding protein [Phycisphaerae bacterium]|nr:ATP-binding protein [Phycisphaerae bacterium]
MTAIRPYSIRTVLEWRLTLGSISVLAVGGLTLYAVMRVALTAEFDADLLSKARALAAVSRAEPDEPGHVEFEAAAEALTEFLPRTSPNYFQIWFDGHDWVVARSGSLAGEDFPAERPAHVDADGSAVMDVALPDGRAGRAIWLRTIAFPEEVSDPLTGAIRTTNPIPILVAVATDREAVDRPLRIVATALLALGVAMGLGTVVIVRLCLRRGLRPLARLGSAVGALDVSRLPAGLAIENVPAELEGMRDRINELLGRTSAALERERRFSGAAAHELRTPIAELLSLLDVRLRWPESEAHCIASMREARTIGEWMAEIADTLLRLARSQHAATVACPDPTPLAPVVRKALERVSQSVAQKRLHTNVDLDPAAACSVDPGSLGSIVENLLSNAIIYTPAGGTIDLVVRAHEFAIRNAPVDLTESDLLHMFEPFWRKDEVRTSITSGTLHVGLGLSIVQSLAAQSGGEISAVLDSSDAGTRLSVRVKWPR